MTPEQIKALREELMLASMKRNFTLTRDEVAALISFFDETGRLRAIEAAARALAAELPDNPHSLAHYHAKEELIALRALLGEVTP